MSSSGLIYAAIAIMWAAVLIPMWLRNHDAATENRSAERFGQAMRVLSRREGRDVDGDEFTPEQGTSDEVPAAPAARPTRAATRSRIDRQPVRKDRKPAPKPRPVLTLAQRRARSLGVLSGVTFVMIFLATVSPLPWWSVLPFVVLVGAFVVHLRIQARQKEQRRDGAMPGRRSQPAASRQDRSQGDEAVASSSVVQGPSRAVVVEKKGETAASAASPPESAIVDDDDAWRPNPLPLPTYVTAPKAVRPIKVIDLTTPGAWTSGRLLEDDLADEDLLAAQVAEDELDALLEQEVAVPAADADEQKRRAVGD